MNRRGKGRKITPKGLIKRVVDAIPKQYRGLFDYSAAMADGVPKLEFKLNTAGEMDYIKALWEGGHFYGHGGSDTTPDRD